MAPFIIHASGRSCRRLMRVRTGAPVTNSTASPASFSRSMRMGCACAPTALTLNTESAPEASSNSTLARMSSAVRSGEVGCRIITASGR